MAEGHNFDDEYQRLAAERRAAVVRQKSEERRLQAEAAEIEKQRAAEQKYKAAMQLQVVAKVRDLGRVVAASYKTASIPPNTRFQPGYEDYTDRTGRSRRRIWFDEFMARVTDTPLPDAPYLVSPQMGWRITKSTRASGGHTDTSRGGNDTYFEGHLTDSGIALLSGGEFIQYKSATYYRGASPVHHYGIESSGYDFLACSRDIDPSISDPLAQPSYIGWYTTMLQFRGDPVT